MGHHLNALCLSHVDCISLMVSVSRIPLAQLINPLCLDSPHPHHKRPSDNPALTVPRVQERLRTRGAAEDLAGAGPVATGINLLLPSPSRFLRQRSLSSTGLVSPKLPRGMLPALPGEPAMISPGHGHREVSIFSALPAEYGVQLGLEEFGPMFVQPPPPLLRHPPSSRVFSTRAPNAPPAEAEARAGAGGSIRRTPSGRLVRTYMGQAEAVFANKCETHAPPVRGACVPSDAHHRTAMTQSCESQRSGLARGDRKWSLNEGHIPNQRRTRTCEYGLQPCRGESAGVAKRPRERPPTRNPTRHDSQLFASLYIGRVDH